MTATEQRKFGTLDLTKANGIIVREWRETILYDASFDDRTDGRGSLRTRDAIAGREIQLAGDIRGADADTTRGNLDAFLAQLENREDYLQLFSTRRYLCGIAEPVDYSYDEGTGYSLVKWKATFRGALPTWESTTASTGSASIVAGTSGTLVMPINDGWAAAWPEIAITNDGSSFSGLQIILTNTSTGAQFSLDGAQMGANDTVTVDMLNRRIVGDGGVSAIPTMVSGQSGEWWSIDSFATQTLAIQLSASSSVTVDVTFRARYWSA